MKLHRVALVGSLLIFLAALSYRSLGASVEENPTPTLDASTRPGAFSRFMSAHGWRLLWSAGIDKAADVYRHRVGPSQEPLLFEEVPGFDAAIHATLTRGTESPTYLGRYGLETFRYGVPLVLIGLDFGHGHETAEDLFGAADAFFMNRGLTSLVKDLVGRVRPDLEYADRRALGPAAFQALEESRDEHRSFPSGHASGSFTWASYLDRVVARKFGMRSAARKWTFAGLYGAAAYVGYTRIREGEHYFSDIVAGAALGIWVSRFNYRAEHPEEFVGRDSRPKDRRSARVRFYPPQIVNGGASWTLGIRLGAERGSSPYGQALPSCVPP